MCIPTFVDFFLFHLFFLCFFRFLFPSFLFSLLAGSLLHFFPFFFVRSLPDSLIPRFIPIFFHQVFFHPGQRRHCDALPPHPPHYLSLLTMSLLMPAGDQLVVRGGNAHFLPPHKNTIEGDRRKQNRRTNTNKLGVSPRAEEGMQHYMHVHS